MADQCRCINGLLIAKDQRGRQGKVESRPMIPKLENWTFAAFSIILLLEFSVKANGGRDL